MTTAAARPATLLANCAFGDDPGRWPLPAARTPHDLWLRSVAAGGQGRYASALADLSRLRDAGPAPVSLAYSTRASFLRQLGWHTVARGWDGRALAAAGTDPEARADALVGLAADALGVGRFAVSARLLARAREQISGDAAGGRLPVRQAWVDAELAMARGDGPQAVTHAERAVAAAASFGSARHAVKSEVVLAAALCSAGAHDRSRRVADAALDAAGRLGLIPLRWALACLLSDIGSAAHPASRIGEIRDGSAAAVRRRGGVWRGH